MSEIRVYDLVDIDLLKESPQRWTIRDYERMGQCEYYLRTQRDEQGSRSCATAMRLLIRSAMGAHYRQQSYCPWDAD